MDKLDLYKNKAQERTTEYIEEYKKSYKTDGTMIWDQYSNYMGENLLRDLEEIHSFYINRIDSHYKSISVEDFCMPYVEQYQDACRTHIQNVQGL